jgi:hypothetical protein
MHRHLSMMLVAIPITLIAVPSREHLTSTRTMQAHTAEPQHSTNSPRANQGRIPPPPPARTGGGKPEEEHRPNGRVDNSQHVNNDHWYGHDAPNDTRYHLATPFEHGHFEHFGPNYRYNVVRIDRDHHRFWFPGGFGFEIAAWDWPIAADWCWDCGNDFVVYEDPDHVGWYLLYNIHTGAYVHITYLGT